MRTRNLRLLLAPLAISTALALSACGDDPVVDQEKVDAVKQQTEQLQQEATQLQDEAQKIADDVKSGKITETEAEAALKKKTDEIEAKAKGVASDSIDAIEDTAGLSDADKKAIEDAKEQLAK